MGKEHKVKYIIIPEKLMKDLVEFIDEVQFEATKVNTTENHHLINLCNYLISSLINSDSFNEEYGNDKSSGEDERYWTSSSTDFLSYDMNMSDEEYEKLLNSFDSFMRGFQKETSKAKHKEKKKTTLEELASDLRHDIDLTPKEKFELYYDEHRKRKNQGESMDVTLKKLGIKKPKKNIK